MENKAKKLKNLSGDFTVSGKDSIKFNKEIEKVSTSMKDKFEAAIKEQLGYCPDQVVEVVYTLHHQALQEERGKNSLKEIIDFAQWYSGMDRDKVERAYKRYLREREIS